ncbi:metalloprotease [Halobacteria archaeon HArc-gm2]|nr:metalloprotease [Halobacteria archaeon HArc-gm2]
MNFSAPELRDLAVAWVTLGVAFTVLLERAGIQSALRGNVASVAGELGSTFAVSMVTVGVGFLFHELAHKVVAVQFGQVAEFRADYSMLFVAVVGAFMGFLFAAPGAVHHRGRITPREHGLIAVAGPVTNLVFGAVFVGAWLVAPSGILSEIAWFGLLINFLLAGFNMIPFGPLDGKTVLDWSKGAYAVVALPSFALAALVVFAIF